MTQLTSRLAALLAAPLVALLPLSAIAEERSRVLVELFTSQGCNSCPPADAALGRLAGEDGIVALSLHVDYWDYLGWMDTFADRAHTKRQYAYRAAFRERAVYTPQMVIQGRAGVVGSHERKVAALIAEAMAVAPAARIDLAAGAEGLVARLVSAGAEGPLTLWRALYDKSKSVAIGRGENRDKTITYTNVVRELGALREWDAAQTIEVALPAPGPDQGVALWLQRGEAGPVLGAAKFEN